MKKSVLAILLPVVLGLTTSVVSGREVFVRKRTVPGFFMPENAMEKPKTVFPTPQYYSGQAETVKSISNEDNAKPQVLHKTAEKTVKTPTEQQMSETKRTPAKKTAAGKALAENDNKREELIVRDDNPNIPEYQKKYQEYLSALEYVAQGKKMPHDQALDDDLAEMSTNARELIEKRKSADKSFNDSRPQTEEVLEQK